MNNNEDLNAISLGNVDSGANQNVPINDIPPVQPLNSEPLNNGASDVEPLGVETLNGDNSNPIPIENASNPVNPVSDINNVPPVAPVAPVDYEVPQAINNVNETPFFNEIGTVPPIPSIPEIPNPPIGSNLSPQPEEPKKKKSGVSKAIFMMIIVLALAAVGVGVYIFLHTSVTKAGTGVVVKDVKIEYGSEISTNINDYAEFKTVNSANCSLNTTGITSTKKLGEQYSFTITCSDKTYTGKATIVDTSVPEVEVKEVEVGIEEEVLAEDFIDTCTDASECSYKFKDESVVDTYLKEAGEYEVVIIVSDESKNEVEVTAKLIVSDTIADLYVNCTKMDANGNTYVTKFGLKDNVFNKVGIRLYTFKLEEADYNSLKEQYGTESSITYSSITGTPEFDDDNLSLTIRQKITYEELVQEAGSDLPSGGGELRNFYNGLGYSCLIGY